MKRRLVKNNDGYTLVEMIIVIAIVAVLTGAAMITLSIMHSAKAKEAAITFESEISTLLNKSKGKACDVDMDGIISDNELEYANYGLRLYKHGDKCYLQQIVIWDGAYKADAAYEKANNVNDGKGISMSAYVYCKFKPLGEAEYTIGSAADEDAIIYFDRSGVCRSGYGTYDFVRDNGVSAVKLTLNKNGSHQAK